LGSSFEADIFYENYRRVYGKPHPTENAKSDQVSAWREEQGFVDFDYSDKLGESREAPFISKDSDFYAPEYEENEFEEPDLPEDNDDAGVPSRSLKKSAFEEFKGMISSIRKDRGIGENDYEDVDLTEKDFERIRQQKNEQRDLSKSQKPSTPRSPSNLKNRIKFERLPEQPLMTSFFFPDDMISSDPYFKEGTCRIYKRKKLSNSKRFYLNQTLVRKRLMLKDWETPVVEDPKYKLLFEEAKRLVLKSKKYDNFNKKKNLKWIADQLNIESQEEAMRMWKELVPIIQRSKVLRDIMDVENEQTE
jgi:hypothetical protein